MITQLQEDHVIYTMMKEHDHIILVLNELTDISNQLLLVPFEKNQQLLKTINKLSLKLINAEPHHQREEQVLFPALEKEGVLGPTSCMRAEHDAIRLMKHNLYNQTLDLDIIKKMNLKNISIIINNLCNTLHLHIKKENTILYPLALQKITDKILWGKMKKKCDNIGYCCFCPKEKNTSKII